MPIALERMLVVNGSMELVWLIAQIFLRLDDWVLSLQSTLREYVWVAWLMEAGFYACIALLETDFQVDAASAALQRLDLD